MNQAVLQVIIPPIPELHNQNQHPLSQLNIPPNMQSTYSKMRHYAQKPLFIYEEGRKIKPKMLMRLFNWMENSCSEAFEFSYKTFQFSTKILLHYLKQVDEPFTQLQMLGCVALHLSSKINQTTIVCIQSYRHAADYAFSKQQFQAKQIQMTSVLDCNLHYSTLFGVIDFFKVSVKLENEQKDKLKQYCRYLVKDPEFWPFSVVDIVRLLLIELKTEGFPLPKQNLLQKLKNI